VTGLTLAVTPMCPCGERTGDPEAVVYPHPVLRARHHTTGFVRNL
jgi:hypothetical protein